MKKKTKWILIVIAAAVVIAGVAAAILIPKMGAEKSTAAQDTADTIPSVSDNIDFEDDSLALTIGGEEMTMGEYLSYLVYSKNVFETNYGEITDWTAEAANGSGLSNYDAVKTNTENTIRLFTALNQLAEEKGVALTAAEEEQMQSTWDSLVEQYGGEDQVEEIIEQFYGSKEAYEYFSSRSYIYQDAVVAIYGAGGDSLTDEEVRAYTAEEGYLQAMHILLKNTDDSGTELSDAEKNKTIKQAEALIKELKAYEGEALKEHFAELVAEYSEDPGGANGYLFQQGDMVTEFYEGTKALEEYEVSGIIETSYGYHIILRLPVDPSYTPTAYSKQGVSLSLREITADNMFYDMVMEVGDTLEIKYEPKCENLNAATVFAG